MTKPEPTPVFRRFPWIQLVFCIACLSMAAWTWMRYSYAWAVTPVAVIQQMPVDANRLFPHYRHPWLDGYVAIRGQAIHFEVREFGNPVEDRGWRLVSPVADKSGNGEVWERAKIYSGMDELVASVGMYFGSDRPPAEGEVGVWRGRVVRMRDSPDWPAVDATASRFHGASIVGLVVGAMGCFIFGMYLRGWLRERKALASQPPQDMIA